MVASEPVEGECTKTKVEARYVSLITRMKLKDPNKLGKLDVDNEILCIMKLKPKLDREIERNAEDLILDEYRKNMQENSRDTLKENLYKALQQRDEALEELSDLQVKHENLVRFIEEKNKKLYAANLRNIENDKDLVDLFVYSLQEIFSFNKELKSEDERDDDEQEEEEGEKGGRSGKGGDVDDSDDDDDDEEGEKEEEDGGGKGGDEDKEEEDGGGKGGDKEKDEEEGGGEGGDLHDDDNDKEGSKGGDEEDKTESEKNEVPSETPKKPSTTLPKTNEIHEDQMELDNQDVRNTTQTAEINEATIIAVQAISQLDPKGMLPVEEYVILLTQGEDIEKETYKSIEDLLDNLSESVFVKLEKGCYRTTPSEVKEKTTTVIRHDCPSFSLLSQEDPKEQSSQKSLSNEDVREMIVAEAVQFNQQNHA
ncbi:centromere-binding protein 1-like [Papaver somniferum]|uniref:centromere-binding protein 1-like n=1 Tax=Papaver somniferum TaxID=3469 RepID=UPI000E6F4F73|nr:centromere-binding protein 1-like [Papaver somniferum]